MIKNTLKKNKTENRIDQLLNRIYKFQKMYRYETRIKCRAYNNWWNEIDYLIGEIRKIKRIF